MKYEAVIFDLDGTVLDTLGDLAASVNHALASRGLTERSLDEIRAFVGNGIKNLVSRSAGQSVGEREKEILLDTFRKHYALHCADETKPYAGIPELLTELKEKGVKTAVVSNKAHGAVVKLAEKYFPGQFSCVLGERDGIPRKPAPDSVEYALSCLGVKKENAVYVGDSEVDILTARNAGLESVIVTWGFRDRETLEKSGAEKTADDPARLREMLGL